MPHDERSGCCKGKTWLACYRAALEPVMNRPAAWVASGSAAGGPPAAPPRSDARDRRHFRSIRAAQASAGVPAGGSGEAAVVALGDVTQCGGLAVQHGVDESRGTACQGVDA